MTNNNAPARRMNIYCVIMIHQTATEEIKRCWTTNQWEPAELMKRLEEWNDCFLTFSPSAVVLMSDLWPPCCSLVCWLSNWVFSVSIKFTLHSEQIFVCLEQNINVGNCQFFSSFTCNYFNGSAAGKVQFFWSAFYFFSFCWFDTAVLCIKE